MIYLIAVLCFNVAQTLLAPVPQHSSYTFGWREKFSYSLFISSAAFSPVWGGIVASSLGLDFSLKNALSFAWISIAVALPLSLIVARLFGSDSYERYWSYLIAFRSSTRRKITVILALASIATLLLGMLLLAVP